MTVALAAYRVLTDAAAPALRWLLAWRLRRGREDPQRLDERFGAASAARPPGPLVWLHAASVGESLSLLPLVEDLRRTHPTINLLVTTGTVTSARLLVERLPPGVQHQYVPLDRRPWVRRFLDHWQPDLALHAESELWPNLMAETQARGIPTGLLNARMSDTSFRNWRTLPGLIRPIMRNLDLCLAQSEEQAGRLAALGAPSPRAAGNLKCAGRPLDCDEAELRDLRARLTGRPVWLAASTHPGEERAAAEVHSGLAAERPDLVTLLAPRHPVRAGEIETTLSRRGLRVARRSRGERPDAGTQVYLADTLGELGLLYRLSEIAFIGGSLSRHGGHNPVEAAQLDCAVVYGPDMRNFAEVAAAMAEAGASEQVRDAYRLTAAVGRLLSDAAERHRRIEAGRAVAAAQSGVLQVIRDELEPLLARLDDGDRGAHVAAGE